jgi:Tol biopolymer transport system component
MKKLLLMIAILTLLAFSFGSLAQQNGYDLFQKALAKERAEGNLEEAIALYKKVIDKTKDESLAAKAQFRIGICFEKLGQEKAKQALEAFQKVIDKYPGQIEIVRLAKDKLTLLLQARASAEKLDKEFSLRKISTGSEKSQGGISPDGRFISFIDWDTGDLAVHDLTTGNKQNITNKGSWDVSGAMTMYSTWSPDGKFIAYDWWDWDTKPNFVGIRVASSDGSQIRTRFEVSPAEISFTHGWSPDGRFILAGVRKSPTVYQLVLIAVNDGSVRIVKEFDAMSKIVHADFSPDGNSIIIERPQEENLANNDLFLISIKDGKEVQLIKHPADDRLLGCAHDGKSVLFASDRRGTKDAWLLELERGEAKGEPRLIKESLGEVEPLGFSQDGSFYYISSNFKNDIYVVALKQEAGKLLEMPKRPIQYIGKSCQSPAYSPDGKFLAFISIRRTYAKSRYVICVRNLDTNEDQDFYPGHVNLMDLKWSPDGRFLFTRASDRPVSDFGSPFYNYMICRVDTQTGEVQTITQSEADENGKINRFINSFDCSRDGKLLFYVAENNKEKKCEIIERNLQTEEEKTLFSVGSLDRIYIISISPDGKWLALTGSTSPIPGPRLVEGYLRHIKIVPVEGGEPRELLNWKPDIGFLPWCAWTNEGKHVLFSKARLDGTTEFWGVPIFDGEPQMLGFLEGYGRMRPGHMRHLSLHPNKPVIAFDSSTRQDAEIWMMRNFLSGSKAEGGQK